MRSITRFTSKRDPKPRQVYGIRSFLVTCPKPTPLSGLRIGWIIDANDTRRQGYVDARGYFTISNSVVTEHLAAIALSNHTIAGEVLTEFLHP